MTTLDDLFAPADLKAEIDAGYVTRKRHPAKAGTIVARIVEYLNGVT